LRASEKYFGDQPDISMKTFDLWRHTAIISSCHGHEGWHAMIVSSGKSPATSSRWGIGRQYLSLSPMPPGVPAPKPVVPEWNCTAFPRDRQRS
jgi:hypothetical protein